MAMTGIENTPALRVSDADRNGTLRRLHNAVALGLIDIGEFEERSAQVSTARLPADWTCWSRICPGRARSSPRRPTGSNCAAGSARSRRHGEWTVPTRLALVRRVGSVELDLTNARFAGPVVVIELDLVRGSLDLRLPEGACASHRRRHGLRRQRA